MCDIELIDNNFIFSHLITILLRCISFSYFVSAISTYLVVTKEFIPTNRLLCS